jgi:hypothetical protein
MDSTRQFLRQIPRSDLHLYSDITPGALERELKTRDNSLEHTLNAKHAPLAQLLTQRAQNPLYSDELDPRIYSALASAIDKQLQPYFKYNIHGNNRPPPHWSIISYESNKPRISITITAVPTSTSTPTGPRKLALTLKIGKGERHDNPLCDTFTVTTTREGPNRRARGQDAHMADTYQELTVAHGQSDPHAIALNTIWDSYNHTHSRLKDFIRTSPQRFSNALTFTAAMLTFAMIDFMRDDPQGCDRFIFQNQTFFRKGSVTKEN